jgi:hypothetical protein
MKRAMALVLFAIAPAGCSGGPDRAELSSEFHAERGLRIAVLDVDDGFGGFEPEAVRGAFVERLSEIGYRGAAVKSADRTPARAALAAREAGQDAALVVWLAPSARPIHPRDPEDAFGRRIYPTPPPGRWFWIHAVLVDARDGSVLFRAESELREPGLRPRDLAFRMLRPLED